MSTEELARELLASDHPHLAGITFDALRERRSLPLTLPHPFRPYASGSHHEGHKIHFGSPAPRQLEFEEQPTVEYPLRLISPPGSHMVNSTMGNVESLLRQAGGEPEVLLNPADANDLSITHGQRARITSRQGSIVRRVRVTDSTRRGVVVAVGLWWPKRSPDRRGLNELTSQRLTDFGGGSCFGNAVVRVEKIQEGSS